MSYSSINRTVLVGRLTRDPELQALPSGHNVCDLRIACNGSRRDPDGTYHERPSYFDVCVYGPQADPIGRYLRKGSAVAVDGHLEWREWETAEGQKRQAIKVVADSVQFLDRRGTGDRAGGDSRNGSAPEEELTAEIEEDREVELVF
jgi:single-strand DNA-binding protein